jgi:hypothetical protein
LLLAAELRRRSFTVFTRHEIYADRPDVDDVTWLSDCGSRGWVALTKDRAIKRRPAEIAAVLNARVRMFVIGAGNLTADQQAAAVIAAAAAMRRWVSEQPAPFIVKLAADGRTALVAPHARPARDRRMSRTRSKPRR